MRLLALPVVVFPLVTASFGLSGCGSMLPSMDFLSGSSKIPAKLEPEGLVAVTASVVLLPLAGPPQPVSDRMIRMVDAASRRAGLALLNYDGAEGDYRLGGDLKIVRLKNKVKVVYNWQVFDQAGARLGSTSGSQIALATGPDPWSEINESALQFVAGQGIAEVERLAKSAKPMAPEAPAPVFSPAAMNSAVQPVSTGYTALIDTGEALRLVNDYRASKSLAPLILDSSLTVAASALSADMAKRDHESHSGPNGANLAKRLTAAQYNFGLAAENVGAGQRSLTELIEVWKRIPLANRNMLLSDAKQMGIAYQYRADATLKTYWTLVIASPR